MSVEHSAEQRRDTVDLRPLAATIDVDALSAHLTEVMLDEVYGQVIDPDVLRAPLQRATREKAACLVGLIAGDVALEDVDAPSSLLFAAEVGRQGVSEQVFERSYRVGQEALWDWWMDVVQRHGHTTGAPVIDVARASIPLLFGFVDRLLFGSLAAYHGAVAERRQSLEHRRLRLVEQLLDGTLTDPGVGTERFLNYALDGHHLAGVIDGGEADRRRVVAALKEACHERDSLLFGRADGIGELWLGLRGPMTAATRQALHAAAADAGARLAFGDVDRELAGFRRTMESARNAAKVQAMLGDNAPRVIWADDVRIEILALGDARGAHALIRRELGPAIDEGLLTARMHATLAAWLTTGSYVGAAALLGVHEQTIRQRLRRLETTLDHPLHERRTELHVALRLSRLPLLAQPLGA